ncbi:hypothetical protein [Ensifer sp. ENS03]|uniref:hypothetical protein n=1 Tax=Ensifer sp. ENS03 TaxID=2769283 RepID=UPI0017833015|nr:hypothetical protein [Ensifer sp. ENS03]MBD9558455.1 hypothetical protein [Ensifer sp. ENS03]
MTWTAERYFAKAQKYWERSTNLPRETEEFLLSTSFVCEFAIRGVLCTVNPALNAAADEESILFAAGAAANKPPRTLDVASALARALRLVPAISTAEGETISVLFNIRNRELHSDEDALSAASQYDVMPKFFSFIVKLADFAGQDLMTILTESDAIQARQTADAIAKDRTKRIKDLIKIQKDRFFALDKAAQDERRKNTPKFIAATTTSGHRLKTYKCPSCAELGLLGGSPVGRSAPILREDGIYEELRIVPDIFECKCCDLKIVGLDELMAAGVAHEFQVLDDKDIVEHFNIDPMDYIDVDEIVREHNDEMFGYQDE